VPIIPGTRLGPYEVQDFIGQGAMGVVYRAYHSQLERTGAVKVMQALAPDPDATARFRHEAKAIAQMRHPNILNVYDFGDFQGIPYMIVEYVPGGSLANRLSRGSLDHAAALKYLRGIAAGLDYAHSMGVVHRDVKPANVLIAIDDTPILADFGLAKLLQGSSLKSMSGLTTGTPAYMAPEQVMGSQVGPAADRYALATIAYEMLTGVIPFEGDALLELLYAQVHRYPQPPSARNPKLSSHVDDVIMRGLAKDPAWRWESCSAFVDALPAALAGREPVAATTMVMTPATAAPPLPPQPVQAPPAPPPPSAPRAQNAGATVAVAFPSPPPPVPRRRSHRGLIVAVAGLVVLVLAATALLAFAAAHQRPSLALSSMTVSPGAHISVSASHLPPNQSGELQLFSQEYVFPFRADGSGAANVPITIPLDITSGDHVLKMCWNRGCPAQVSLLVVGGLAIPPPYYSPSASPVPSPTAPRPTPSPAGPPALALDKGNVKLHASLNVYGLRFVPGQSVTITFAQSTSDKYLTTTTVNSAGTFSAGVLIPSTAVPGPAAIRACAGTSCAYATITVSA
jgi:serine/threonine protein kinase